MLHRVALYAGFLLAIVSAAGCSDSDDVQVTGKGSVRGLHAVPELGAVSFMIEETQLSSLDFKDASGLSEYDNLEYNFNFDIRLPGDDEATRLGTHKLRLDAETAYTFALTGTLDDPEIVLWEYFGRDWQKELDDAEKDDKEVVVLETAFGHLDPSLGNVDVYLEAPGTSPQHAEPVGTLEYGKLIEPVELEEGDYQLVLTPSGNPASILFASGELELGAATTSLFVVMPDGGLSTSDFSVRWIGNGVGADLTDLFAEPALDVLHAAHGSGPIDVVIGDEFAEPFVAGLDYLGLSSSAPVDHDPAYLTVTPAGNPGVFLVQKEVDLTPGRYKRLLLTGLPGNLQAVPFTYDRRSLATHARLQVFQAAARFQSLDIYIVADDVDISLVGPTYSRTLFGSGTGFVPRVPDRYNIVVTEPGTKTIVGGPFAVDLEATENYSVAIVDSPDITAADIVLVE